MKIKENMLFRTKDGIIGKEVYDKDINPNLKKIMQEVDEEDAKKAGFNAVDIIERGDLVNGHIVVDIIQNNRKKEPSTMIYCEYGNGLRGFYNEGIKTIITKESLKDMEIRINEK